MKPADIDVIEDEATEREIPRIRQKRGKQMSELDYAREYEGAVTTETRAVQWWNCPDCLERILWQSPMTKAERIYHHYRVGHKEGGSLVAPQPEPDTGGEWLSNLVAELPKRHRDDDGAMQSACGEYNCPCHYDLPRAVASAALVPQLTDILRLVQRLLTNQKTCEQALCASCNHARQTVLESVDIALALVKGRE